MNGSNNLFHDLWKHVVEAWQLVASITKYLYVGNTIAIGLTLIVILAGVFSLFYVRLSIISPSWIAQLPVDRQKYYEALRGHLCGMKIWTLGSFLIASLLFIIASSLSAGAAPALRISSGHLETISFLTKGIIVGAVIARVIRISRALRQTAL